MTKPLHGSYELKYKTGLTRTSTWTRGGQSENSFQTNLGTWSSSYARKTQWPSIKRHSLDRSWEQNIKRVKESVISGESLFEAYMQTRIRKRRNSTRFDINSDTRIDEIHEPVSITELHVVQDRNRKGHRRASRKRAGLSIHGENKQVNK